MGFWVNARNTVCGKHKIKIFEHITHQHKIHQLHTTHDFKLLCVLKIAVANKQLNGTTEAVGTLNSPTRLHYDQND